MLPAFSMTMRTWLKASPAAFAVNVRSLLNPVSAKDAVAARAPALYSATSPPADSPRPACTDFVNDLHANAIVFGAIAFAAKEKSLLGPFATTLPLARDRVCR